MVTTTQFSQGYLDICFLVLVTATSTTTATRTRKKTTSPTAMPVTASGAMEPGSVGGNGTVREEGGKRGEARKEGGGGEG